VSYGTISEKDLTKRDKKGEPYVVCHKTKIIGEKAPRDSMSLRE
jgi:hypothetical protein